MREPYKISPNDNVGSNPTSSTIEECGKKMQTVMEEMLGYMTANKYATFVYQELSRVFHMRYDMTLSILRELQAAKKVANFKNRNGEVRWYALR